MKLIHRDNTFVDKLLKPQVITDLPPKMLMHGWRLTHGDLWKRVSEEVKTGVAYGIVREHTLGWE